jgi:hypothetical protein
MVTDPTNPPKIFQTADFGQQFRHTTLKEVITTGNFGMLSASLKNPTGQWTFKFCR